MYYNNNLVTEGSGVVGGGGGQGERPHPTPKPWKFPKDGDQTQQN